MASGFLCIPLYIIKIFVLFNSIRILLSFVFVTFLVQNYVKHLFDF